MNLLDVAHTYFDAWNRSDPAAIVDTFVEGGTYSDPTVSALTGSALVQPRRNKSEVYARLRKGNQEEGE